MFSINLLSAALLYKIFHYQCQALRKNDAFAQISLKKSIAATFFSYFCQGSANDCVIEGTLKHDYMAQKNILVIGSSNTDMTVKTKALPRPGETVLGGVFTMGAGGKGANQAVAARRLGGDVKFICKVGRDIFGDNSLAHYEKEGLDASGVLRSDLPSGVALITVDDKAEERDGAEKCCQEYKCYKPIIINAEFSFFSHSYSP